MGRPAHRPFLRNTLPNLTTIVPVTAYYRTHYVRDTVGVYNGTTFSGNHLLLLLSNRPTPRFVLQCRNPFGRLRFGQRLLHGFAGFVRERLQV